MKSFFAAIASLFSIFSSNPNATNPLDYDRMIHIDAEEIAERGIKEFYDSLLPTLSEYVSSPIAIQEVISETGDSYAVIADGKRYEIYSPSSEAGHSWVKASIAIFDIVNGQLENANSSTRFYAFYGGNDLSGMFLTIDEYKSAQAFHSKSKNDQPYFVVDEPPYYGYPH